MIFQKDSKSKKKKFLKCGRGGGWRRREWGARVSDFFYKLSKTKKKQKKVFWGGGG